VKNLSELAFIEQFWGSIKIGHIRWSGS